MPDQSLSTNLSKVCDAKLGSGPLKSAGPCPRIVSRMELTRFREARPGPEQAIEQAVASRLPTLVSDSSRAVWKGASPSIGAGMPDLVFAWHDPKVRQLHGAIGAAAALLGYLRSVTRARPETLSERLRLPLAAVRESLGDLVERLVLSEALGCFAVSKAWRNILPEIVAVEAKVSNWRKAVQQAARNTVFAHRSFVAVPESLAKRVRSDQLVKKLGIGVLSVRETGETTMAKKARFREPLIWEYYYQVANLVAKESGNAVHGFDQRGKEADSGVHLLKGADAKRPKSRVSRSR
jgi:hypothetical protein